MSPCLYLSLFQLFVFVSLSLFISSLSIRSRNRVSIATHVSLYLSVPFFCPIYPRLSRKYAPNCNLALDTAQLCPLKIGFDLLLAWLRGSRGFFVVATAMASQRRRSMCVTSLLLTPCIQGIFWSGSDGMNLIPNLNFWRYHWLSLSLT